MKKLFLIKNIAKKQAKLTGKSGPYMSCGSEILISRDIFCFTLLLMCLLVEMYSFIFFPSITIKKNLLRVHESSHKSILKLNNYYHHLR